MKRNLLAALSILALTIALPCFGAQLYQTGFEAGEGFPLGLIPPSGLNGWLEETGVGNSAIVNTSKHSGDQSMQIASNATVNRAITSTDSLVVIDGWYRPPISGNYPDLLSQPAASAIFIFHATDGVVGLNGNGAGSGSWLVSGVDLSDTFHRITTIINFTAKKWSLYIDEAAVFTDLGFKDNSITQLTGLRITASETQSGYLDDFTVSTDPPPFINVPTPTQTSVATLTATPTLTQTPPPPTPTSTPPPSGNTHWQLFD